MCGCIKPLITLGKDFYPLRRSEQLLFSCQSASIRSGAFIVAMVFVAIQNIFCFSKKGCERAISPTTKVAGLLVRTYEKEKDQLFSTNRYYTYFFDFFDFCSVVGSCSSRSIYPVRICKHIAA